MWDLVKKYWDLLSGFIVGLGLSFIAHFNSETMRMIYSVIILVLFSIGLFRLVRQAIDKGIKKRREHNLLDNVVDNQIAVKAIQFAQNPTKVGEKIRKLFMTLGGKNIMKKIKELFDKYKGYLLTVLLGVLTAVENYGGYINALCGGVLMINGVAVLPIVTLVCTIVVGCLSNKYTKGQIEKIKALFAKSSTNELVKAEIKKNLKDNTVKHTQFIKIQATKETELENLKSELESLKNTYNAKVEMYRMIPQLATDEDVQLALNAVNECSQKIANKESEIREVKSSVTNLETMIGALKSQLQGGE